MSVFSKKIDGSEGGAITLTRGASSHMSVIAYTFSAATWHGTTMPEISNANFGGGNQPDPPSLDPSGWGTENTTWIAGVYKGNIGTTGAITAFPTGYTSNQQTAFNSSNYGRLVAATLESAASSENPSAYGNGSNGGMAFTMAVRPAAAAGGTPSRNLMLMGIG